MKYLLLFSFLLFELLSYGQIDTLLRPYKVPIPDYERPDYNDNSITYLVAFDFKIDILPFNFNEFRSQLGDDNIGLMNKANSVLDTELGLFYKDLYGGISVGIGGTNKELDSLNLDFNNHLYGINIGYKIINTKRIIIVPKLGLKLQHFRLINSTIDSKIPLSQYLIERDLYLKFNQMIASATCKIAYKFYGLSHANINYESASVGLYGGYVLKLNKYPWIYSVDNRLISKDRISYKNFNLGLSFTLYLF